MKLVLITLSPAEHMLLARLAQETSPQNPVLPIASRMSLHGRFQALDDHGIFERHEVIERSPLQRIFTSPT